MSVRPPAVSGIYYPKEAYGIEQFLNQTAKSEEKYVNKKLNPKNIIGGIVPHANYELCAGEAIHFFYYLKRKIEKPETIIIINPSHKGTKDEISFDVHDAWNTPMGDVGLDLEFMDFIDIPRAEDAQKEEYGAEVILPYLQFFLAYPFKILPITMQKESYKCAGSLAEKIYKANQVLKRKIIVIASSNFSHNERPELGFYNDNLVINRILNNSIHGLYETIHENSLTICGYGPIMTLMFFSRLINPKYKVEILARGNSSKKLRKNLVFDYVSALFYE